jgi:hypothetical protein
MASCMQRYSVTWWHRLPVRNCVLSGFETKCFIVIFLYPFLKILFHILFVLRYIKQTHVRQWLPSFHKLSQ